MTRRFSLFGLVAMMSIFIIVASMLFLGIVPPSRSASDIEMLPRFESQKRLASLVDDISLPEWIHDYVAFHSDSLNGSSLADDTRFLLYRCHGSCAGIGGRLKTMIKSLYASICSHRVLLIDSPSPFPLEHYLEPNLLQWNTTFQETNFSHHVFRRGEQLSLPSTVLGIQLEELKGPDMMDIQDVFNSDVCQSFFRRNGVSTVLRDEEALYRWGFHTLFRFSKKVSDRTAVLKKEAGLTGPYVGVHIRTNKGENWNDPKREFEGLDAYLRCFHYFHDIHGLKYGYIAADNTQIKIKLQEKDRHLSFATGLQIFHIDKSISSDLGSKMEAPDSLVKWYHKHRGKISNKTVAEQGMLDLFAELLVVVDAECVIMSKSGLSYAMHYIPKAPRCGVFISNCSKESVQHRNHKYVQRLNKIVEQYP